MSSENEMRQESSQGNFFWAMWQCGKFSDGEDISARYCWSHYNRL